MKARKPRLRPCPHCGHPAALTTTHHQEGAELQHLATVYCTGYSSCPAVTLPTVKAAVAKWNQRRTTPAKKPLVRPRRRRAPK